MKIQIFHAQAGYGHFKVAKVIQQTFLARGLRLDEVLLEDALDAAPFLFRKLYPEVYFYSVKCIPKIWGWFYENLDNATAYSFMRPLRSLNNWMVGQKLLARVAHENPDVIICTHFYSAELFATAKRRGKINARLITVITDFYPHSFWVNKGTDFYWVMGREGRDELVRRGVPKGKIMDGGIPIESSFQPSGKKREILARWGMSPDRFTLLLTSGSFGLGPQPAILEELKSFSEKIQCFVVCGNNQSLKSQLERTTFSFPVKIFGFVDFMPELMEASDLIIAKSGGSTTTESLAKGIPMIVLEPIPGQEMRNAKVLADRDAAFFMKKPEQIKVILQTIFDHPEMSRAKQRAIADLAKPHAADDLVTFVLKEGAVLKK